jgi:nucleoside-diphosphate-sugar epimerase
MPKLKMSKVNERVLVTGGAGYIGSVLTRILLSKGYKVRVIDNLSFGGESLIDIFLNPNFEFVKGDIRNEQGVLCALNGVNSVCHLAAIVGDPACRMFSEDARKINWDASVKLFELCEKNAINKFVFASTCSNYGKTKDENKYYIDEDSELCPVSLYAELKVQYEDYLLNKKKNSAICRTVLRYSTVYGASPRLRFDLTVNEFTRDAAIKKQLTIFGEHFWRPYCHVHDLARAAVLALGSENVNVNNQVFNVGDTSENYTKQMLVNEIRKVVKDVDVNFVQQTEDPRDYRVDFAKIQKQLGFEITRRVPDGVKELYSLISSGLISEPYSKKYCNT